MKRIIIIIFAIFCLSVSCGPIYKQVKYIDSFPHEKIKIVDLHEIRWFLYSGYVGEGGCLIIPLIPSTSDDVINRSIFYKDKKVWDIDYKSGIKDDLRVLYFSPLGDSMYVEHISRAATYPSYIYDFRNEQKIDILLPYGILKELYFPLKFVSWSEDGKDIIAILENDGIAETSKLLINGATGKIKTSK